MFLIYLIRKSTDMKKIIKIISSNMIISVPFINVINKIKNTTNIYD